MREYIILAAAACVCGLLIMILRNSKAAKSLALNSFAGFAALGIVNLTGILTKITLAVNLWSLLIAALLGLPGITGLMFLKFMWQV